MFKKTYRSVIKTILRSPMTYGAVFLVFAAIVYHAFTVHYGAYSFDLKMMVWDNEPGFSLNYDLFLEEILNTPMAGLMIYPVPLLCVIVSGIVLIRDFRDGFFEIERAGNIKTSRYLFGRLSAVVSFVTLISLFVCLFAFHLYILSRGGVPTMGTWEYVWESAVRLLRVFVMAIFPGILFFVGVTFLASNIMHSGLAGTAAGICYVIVNYSLRVFLGFRLPEIYTDYLSPVPTKLYKYWFAYDTKWFSDKSVNLFSDVEMIVCLCVLYLLCSAFLTVSAICVKRRKV